MSQLSFSSCAWERPRRTASRGVTTIPRLVVVLLLVAAAGCNELPRTGWPVVVRGASPPAGFDDDIDDLDEPPTPAIPRGETGLLPDAVRKQPRFEATTPRQWDNAVKAFSSAERSPFSFDDDSDDSFFGSPTEMPTDPGTPLPFSGDTGESQVAECEPQPYRFWDDVKETPWTLWADAKSLVTWENAVVLGAAAGVSVAIRDNLDQRVRYETAEHPLRWGQGSVVLRQFGEYSYQVPVIAGVYAAGLWTQDDTLHEFSIATISAYSLNAFATVAIKGITNTTRPTTQFENGHYGFPSYHASSTFTIAACLEEFYGWQVGLPAYALAGLVSWSRIDQREHDLSDVFFGAVLGIVIGKTVSAAHLDRQSDLKLTPYYDVRNQAAGLSLEKRY